MKEPDDAVLVDDMNDIPMTKEQEPMIKQALLAKEERERAEKAEYDAFREKLQAEKASKPKQSRP